MEVQKSIDVLRRSDKTWLSPKENIDEKLNALATIAEAGYLSLIGYLTEFLKDRHPAIHEATCRTIIHLFRKVDSKNGYSDSLKYCFISESDLDYYEVTFPEEQYVELLAISSLNHNGYVREKAVRKLAGIGKSRAIPFLLYRLADWVVPIRQAAHEAVKAYQSVQYIDGLIENLPRFKGLQKVERTDLSGIYREILTFVASTNRAHILTNFKTYPDNQRLLLAEHLSHSSIDEQEVIRLFLADNYFRIRSLAIDHFEKLEQTEIGQLLQDKSARIRLQTLYCLKAKEGFNGTIRAFLADSSALIRYFARFTLQQANVDFVAFYSQNLQVGKQVAGSLGGLAEMEAKQHVEIVKNYLNDEPIKTRKAAFSALRKLDPESATAYAIAHLDTPLVGLRNLIIDFLSGVQRREVLTKAREIYLRGDSELKKAMLKLFYKMGGWVAIPELMVGTIDENETIREMALEYIKMWQARAVRLFSTPRPEERERAKQVFAVAYAIHEDQSYFRTNPLKDLDQYFR